MNPSVGTIALTKGLGRAALKKKSTITMYVRKAMIIFLERLVSQALSASTLALRLLIASISFINSSVVVIFN